MVAYPESLDGRPPPKRYRWWRFVERHLPIIVIYLMVATLVGFIVAPNVIVTVPSGQVGVLWKRFRAGTQLDPRLLKEEGLRVMLPWDQLFLYDLRLQTTTDTYNAISKDGVNLAATINIRFRLKHDAVPQLHQGIGPDYLARLVRPEIGNRAREIIAEYTAEEVYSIKRQEIQKRIRTHTQSMLGQSMMERTSDQSEYGESYRVSLDAMLNLYDTLILGLELPQPVVAAINRKVEQFYLVQEYAFRVDRERKESERKQIEAQGISAFQQTVTQGITDSYLRWRGIEATLQLALSNNVKIVIIGGGKDGLPIILGNVDAPVMPKASAAEPSTDSSVASKASPTAPASTVPLEKTPASNLSEPPEKMTNAPRPPTDQSPPDAAAKQSPPDAAAKQSGAATSGTRSPWDFSLPDILSRVLGSSDPTRVPPGSSDTPRVPPAQPSDRTGPAPR